ncbi:MAG: hypothetical protein KAY65_06115, partial [Planctomycetes bacterium]|nr:hypothetical protein [Planctomycetota bacterium]
NDADPRRQQEDKRPLRRVRARTRRGGVTEMQHGHPAQGLRWEKLRSKVRIQAHWQDANATFEVAAVI